MQVDEAFRQLQLYRRNSPPACALIRFFAISGALVMRVFTLITVNQDQRQLISASLAQEAQVGFLITTTLDYSSCDEIINLVYHLSQIYTNILQPPPEA